MKRGLQEAVAGQVKEEEEAEVVVLFYFIFSFIFISWRLITLQYFSGGGFRGGRVGGGFRGRGR